MKECGDQHRVPWKDTGPNGLMEAEQRRLRSRPSSRTSNNLTYKEDLSHVVLECGITGGILGAPSAGWFPCKRFITTLGNIISARRSRLHSYFYILEACPVSVGGTSLGVSLIGLLFTLSLFTGGFLIGYPLHIGCWSTLNLGVKSLLT